MREKRCRAPRSSYAAAERAFGSLARDGLRLSWMTHSMLKAIGCRGACAAVCAILISACATPAYQPNAPLSPAVEPDYTLRGLAHPRHSGHVLGIMSLLGGG